MNVTLPPRTPVNLYASTGITVGTQISTLNLTPSDVRLYWTVGAPNASDDHVVLLYGRGMGVNDAGDPGAWAMSVAGSEIDVKVVV